MLLGLPLAIIGLLVQDILARKNALRAERNESVTRVDKQPPPSLSERASEGAASSGLLNTSIAGGRASKEEAALARTKRRSSTERPGVTPDPHAIAAAASVRGDRTVSARAPDRRA